MNRSGQQLWHQQHDEGHENDRARQPFFHLDHPPWGRILITQAERTGSPPNARAVTRNRRAVSRMRDFRGNMRCARYEALQVATAKMDISIAQATAAPGRLRTPSRTLSRGRRAAPPHA